MCVTKGKCVTQGMSKMCHSGYILYTINVILTIVDKQAVLGSHTRAPNALVASYYLLP